MKRLLICAVLPCLLAPLAVAGKADSPVDADEYLAIEPVQVVVRAGAEGAVITVDGTPQTLEGLSAIIKYQTSLNPGQPVRITGDAGLRWEDMAEVVSACDRAGAKNISFTLQENKKEEQ